LCVCFFAPKVKIGFSFNLNLIIFTKLEKKEFLVEVEKKAKLKIKNSYSELIENSGAKKKKIKLRKKLN
jgi:hypothetical protein